MISKSTYDVAVIGGGPVGCLTALAHAQRGQRVLLADANPNAAKRLAGEWLHPPARDALASVGMDIPPTAASHGTGDGFAVFPDDGTEPMVLPYASGTRGFSCEHHELVDWMRLHAKDHANVTWMPWTRATEIEGQRVTLEKKGAPGAQIITAGRIIGADGRASTARKSLGLPVDQTLCSRMVGVLLHDVTVPFEGSGHVFLGGPGPLLAYRIGDNTVRLVIDVPAEVSGTARRRLAYLWQAYSPRLPASMRPAFRDALRAGRTQWAANQVRPRTRYGRPGLVLVGDACGHYHPLTAVGMTLGFGDAVALAQSRSFATYRLARKRATRVPEMLSVALYEVFADTTPETIAIRQAVYKMWRESPKERVRTMRFLAGQSGRLHEFGAAFGGAVRRALGALGDQALKGGGLGETWNTTKELGRRMRWLTAGLLHMAPPTSVAAGGGMVIGREQPTPRTAYEAGMNAGADKAEVVALEPKANLSGPRLDHALRAGIGALARAQRDDGAWEGENVWCAMLPAQFVIACHALGQPIAPERRTRILRQFEVTRDAQGLWGLHAESPPTLFVTSLVVVAARLLGLSADDALIERGQGFIQREDLTRVPTWGKVWLSIAGVFDWEGVPPVLPELWALPKALPVHPSRWYCHTRLIYLAMGVLYARRTTGPIDATVRALRADLYPLGYHTIAWKSVRNRLRDEEIFTPWSLPLKAMMAASGAIERVHNANLRARLVDGAMERIRWDQRATDDANISPVSGLLNLLCLHGTEPEGTGKGANEGPDPDLAPALARFEGWIWEDDIEGLRIAGSRSATWDSGFAMQALAAVPKAALGMEGRAALKKGADFLQTQQITDAPSGYEAQDRIDPNGGFCFSGRWHGWPVSDCTAEAALGLGEAADHGLTTDLGASEKTAAARFILRCHNPDGGFGSYEAQKGRVTLEWMNPAEMFGDSMTEHSYVECTASAVTALAHLRDACPEGLKTEIDDALTVAGTRLRRMQRTDGAWDGVWGVGRAYGTMFGIRGLKACGAPTGDPAIRLARRALLSLQRPDGGWGEGPPTVKGGDPVAVESQVVQTAWALTALIEAEAPDRLPLERAAAFIASHQDADGEWPKQRSAGVFFHTALLDYRMYRRIFPLQALGLWARREAKLEDALGSAPMKKRRRASK